MQLHTTIRRAMLDAIESAMGPSPRFNAYSATSVPAKCTDAATGTLQAGIVCPSDWMAPAAALGEVVTKELAGIWSATATGAGGPLSYYRIMDTTGSTCFEQGLLYTPWLANMVTVVGLQVSNGGNVYRCTTAGAAAAAGGPVGTGTGIADGAAVWAFIGVADGIQIDKGVIATGDTFSIIQKTLQAAGNA